MTIFHVIRYYSPDPKKISEAANDFPPPIRAEWIKLFKMNRAEYLSDFEFLQQFKYFLLHYDDI